MKEDKLKIETILKLKEISAMVGEQVARSRSFNTGLCLGMHMKMEGDLYSHFKVLDVLPDNLHKIAKVAEEYIKELEKEDEIL